MGHEYVEMKNTHAAVEAYRRAVGSSRFSGFLSNRNAHQLTVHQMSTGRIIVLGTAWGKLTNCWTCITML
jgi:hypothetical protein